MTWNGEAPGTDHPEGFQKSDSDPTAPHDTAPDGQLLQVDGPRPLAAWVSSLPSTWTTAAQRLVLLCLALDTFPNSDAARPGWDRLIAWTGMSRSTISDALQALQDPIEGLRPALVVRVDQRGHPMEDRRRSRSMRAGYRLIIGSGPLDGSDRLDGSGPLDLEAPEPVDNSLKGSSARSSARSGPLDPPFPTPSSTHLGTEPPDACATRPDDDEELKPPNDDFRAARKRMRQRRPA